MLGEFKNEKNKTQDLEEKLRLLEEKGLQQQQEFDKNRATYGTEIEEVKQQLVTSEKEKSEKEGSYERDLKEREESWGEERKKLVEQNEQCSQEIGKLQDDIEKLKQEYVQFFSFFIRYCQNVLQLRCIFHAFASFSYILEQH